MYKAKGERRKDDPKSAAHASARKLETEICPMCGGEGWEVKEEAPGIEVTSPCPECKGNRFVYVVAKKTAPLSAPAAGK